MKAVHLTIDVPGMSVSEMAESLVEYATKEGVRAKTRFQGVPLSAYPHDDPENIARNWRIKMEHRAEDREKRVRMDRCSLYALDRPKPACDELMVVSAQGVCVSRAGPGRWLQCVLCSVG